VLDEPRHDQRSSTGTPLLLNRACGDDPDVAWDPHANRFGFMAAIVRDSPGAAYWDIALNNYMTLAPASLQALAAFALRRVFSRSPARSCSKAPTAGREETGFTDWYTALGVHFYHADPLNRSAPCPALCSAWGRAVRGSATLRDYAIESRIYDPFYWKRVEWAVRGMARRHARAVRPMSAATHRHRRHRSYVRRNELDRIV